MCFRKMSTTANFVLDEKGKMKARNEKLRENKCRQWKRSMQTKRTNDPEGTDVDINQRRNMINMIYKTSK